MIKIQEHIKIDLKIAMLNKNVIVRDLLRVVIGEFDREVKVVSDERATAIIKKMAQNAKDQDNTDEITILEQYLPFQMEKLELKRVLMNHLMNMDHKPSMKDMGSTMSFLKEKHSGQYDGKMASTIVKELLN